MAPVAATTVKQPTVSVVICAYTAERLKDIHEAVDSVLDQTLKPHEVIVAVDHNEELFHTLRSGLPSQVSVVLNKAIRGLSETRNAGIRHSIGEIVAFIDDDAVAADTWLEHLTAHFARPEVAAVGGRAVPQWSDGERPKWFPEELDWIVGCTYKGLPLNGNECRNMIGCNMSFRRDCLQLAGLFSSELGRIGRVQGVGEEAEICLRVKQVMPGKAILYEPEATIYHKVPPWRVGLKYLIQRSYNEGFYKTIVKRLSVNLSGPALSTEGAYLSYLLRTAIPGRLRRFYQPHAISQAGAILLSTSATVTGYLWGSIRR